MKRFILELLGFVEPETPNIGSLRKKYTFPVELIEQRKRPIGLERHMEKMPSRLENLERYL